MCHELGRKERFTQVPPSAEEAKKFWSKLWDNLVPYKDDAEWLKEVELEQENVNIQENVEITKEDITMQLKKIPNQKVPWFDGIQGFWVKRFASQHQRLTEELNENIQSLSITSLLVKNRSVLINVDPAKSNALGNNKQITGLNLLWKLKTGIIADNI